MKELGMTFRGDMVRAIREGRKTQTRRLVEPQPKGFPGWWPHEDVTPSGKWVGNTWHWASEEHFRKGILDHCPLQVGDRIFVQEELRGDGQPGDKRKWIMRYGADGEMVLTCTECGNVLCTCDSGCTSRTDIVWDDGRPATPAKSMPRWAARTWAEITEIRAQRIREISLQDVFAEGCFLSTESEELGDFQNLWESLYPGSWERNEFVWVYNLKTLEVKGRAA